MTRFLTTLPQSVRDALGGVESEPEAALINRLRLAGAPKPHTQQQLIQGRKYRFDLAWPAYKVAVEVQGAVYAQGRHVRGAGYETDCEKSALAQIEGWIVVYATPGMVKTGMAGFLILEALKARNWRKP